MEVMTPKSILVCFSESPVRMSCMASTQEEDVSSVWTATVLNLAERSWGRSEYPDMATCVRCPVSSL